MFPSLSARRISTPISTSESGLSQTLCSDHSYHSTDMTRKPAAAAANPYHYTRRFDFFLRNNKRSRGKTVYGSIEADAAVSLPILERGLCFINSQRLSFFLAKRGLKTRRVLDRKRRIMSEVSFAAVLFGIIVCIIDGECTAQRRFSKESAWSLWLRSLVVISSVVLVILIYCYHAYEIQLVMIDSGTDDWRVAITWKRIFQLIQETIVCSICPIPGTGYIQWPYLTTEDGSIVRSEAKAKVPVDVLLSIPMFLRFYLVGRYMVLHSNSFQDAATRSIAALNRVNVDFEFVTKTLMREKPLRVLIVFTVIFWVAMSWLFTQCERYVSYESHIDNSTMASLPDTSFLNSLWLIVITFLSIGYGDIVPHTYCGRTLTICTGIAGIGIASALVAIISRMLELTKAEKHVNAFMADTKLTTKRNHAAANVLQQTWHIYKYRFQIPDELRLRIHQRRFLAAIHEFRRIKWEQRKLAEQSNRLLDISRVQTDLQARIYELQQGQQTLLATVELMSAKIDGLKTAEGNNN